MFCFFLGRQYARAPWRGPLAIVIGNAAGIVSLLLYLWQFLGKTDETRNTIVAVVSQLFSASVPSYLTGKAALLLSSSPNYVGSEAKVALQVIALVYMLVVFTCGYAWGKKSRRAMGRSDPSTPNEILSLGRPCFCRAAFACPNRVSLRHCFSLAPLPLGGKVTARPARWKNKFPDLLQPLASLWEIFYNSRVCRMAAERETAAENTSTRKREWI